MALSTVTINNTMAWAKRLSWNRNSGIGNELEPALSSANMVLQTILGPPFSWQWNSQALSFTCATGPATSTVTNVAITSKVVTLATVNTWVANQQVTVSGLVTATQLNGQLLTVLTASGTQITAAVNLPDYGSAADTGTLTAVSTQDYPILIPNFSHIVHATVIDISKTPSKATEIEIKKSLSLDGNTARPAFISPNYEDASGIVTFRVLPAPNLAYPVSMKAMLTPPPITSLNQTWAPIPDYMQNVYNWGFLALIWAFADDPRFQIANSKFMAALLSRAQGLTETERNIFLNNWNNITGQEQATTQQGMQARAT